MDSDHTSTTSILPVDEWRAAFDNIIQKHLTKVFTTAIGMMLTDKEELKRETPEVQEIVQTMVLSSLKLYDAINGLETDFSLRYVNLANWEFKPLPTGLDTQLVGDSDSTKFYMSETTPGILYVDSDK